MSSSFKCFMTSAGARHWHFSIACTVAPGYYSKKLKPPPSKKKRKTPTLKVVEITRDESCASQFYHISPHEVATITGQSGTWVLPGLPSLEL